MPKFALGINLIPGKSAKFRPLAATLSFNTANCPLPIPAEMLLNQ
ncbi:hypothetical protein [Pleurocapsa sp. FMAR1]|nr:hypothetical protein [Pleurocapsa sp. FMAR1]